MIRNLARNVEGLSSNAFLVWGDPASTDAPHSTDDPDSTDASHSTDTIETDDEPSDVGRRVLVDCGAEFDVVAAVERHVADIDAVVLTHTHPDHIGTLPELRAAFDVESWGFDTTHHAVDHELGETVQLGTGSFEVIHTPGHEPNHVCLYDDAGTLFAGDLVFARGGFGRTDLPGGDRQALLDSIDRLSDRIGELRVIHAGHGPSVTSEPNATIERARRAATTR